MNAFERCWAIRCWVRISANPPARNGGSSSLPESLPSSGRECQLRWVQLGLEVGAVNMNLGVKSMSNPQTTNPNHQRLKGLPDSSVQVALWPSGFGGQCAESPPCRSIPNGRLKATGYIDGTSNEIQIQLHAKLGLIPQKVDHNPSCPPQTKITLGLSRN